MVSGDALTTTAIRSRNWDAARGGFECRRWRNRRATRHERTSCGRLFETHEPCRSSAVTSRPYQAVVPRSRRCQWGKVPVEC